MALLALGPLVLIGCVGVTGGGGGTAPPPQITVEIAPASGSVLLGTTAGFKAEVSGTTNTAVNWSVNGVAGGNSTLGTVASGDAGAEIYTAPQILPTPASVKVTATSHADSGASGSAAVTIISDVVVGIAPASASLGLGGMQSFTATVGSGGQPSTAVNWSVNGIAGGNAAIGTIASSGGDWAMYTAPASAPSPATVSVAATSVADPSKSAAAGVTIACASPNSMSPALANVLLGQSQTITAALCVAPGTPIVWDVNGVAGGSAALGTIVSAGAGTGANPVMAAATYSAPLDVPVSNPVTIHATAAEQSVAGSVTISSNVAVRVAPASANVAVGGRATFSAVVLHAADTSVIWSVNGEVNGNAGAGQICVSGTNPCAAPVGAIATPVDYLAPATVPAANPVTLTATSNADMSRSGLAIVNVTNSGGVSVLPAYAFVAPSSGNDPSQVQFTASVTGNADASVNWSVQSGVLGAGCGGTACGTIDATGLYTAPNAAPSPNAISVTATNAADSSQAGTALISITSGPAIEQILPSSVMAGVAANFTLEVNGAGFVAGDASTGSVILVNGVSRATICESAVGCSTTLEPGDAAAAGGATIQVQNPGNPGALSNPVSFVVVPFTLTEIAVALNAAQPESDGNDIVVFEPTTAGDSSSQINVDFAGPITAGAVCNFDSSPITLQRPASGSVTLSICIHGNDLDPSFFYAFTGPGDIGIVASSLDSLFPNVIQLDLTISAATLKGVRSLFMTTPNNDKAVASGLVEVK